MDSSHPSSIKEALSITPLLHLLPIQETAPLIGPISLNTSMDVANESSQKLQQTINKNPQNFTGIIQSIADEISEFDIPELHGVKFNQMASSKSITTHLQPQLPHLQQIIYDSNDAISEGDIVPIDSDSQRATYDVARLSIRKKYDEDLQHHNEKYKRKFFKEYNREHTPSHNSTKRPLEHQNAPINLKLPKLIATELERFDRAYEKLVQINSRVGLHLDENLDARTYWIEFGDKHLVSKELLVGYFDCLRTLMHDPKIDTIEIDHIVRIQSLMWRTILESKDFDWNDLRSLFDQENESSHAIQQAFENLFLFTMAAKIMLLILNGELTNKSIYVDEYLTSVVDLVYTLQDDFLVPFASKICKYELASTIQPTLNSLIEEIRSILNMISVYVSKFSVEETTLTRLEYLAVETIFADFNRKEVMSLIGATSLDNLRASAADLLLEIFRNNPDQRDFILNEIIVGIDKLPTLRANGRRFKTLQGTKVQLVTILLVSMVESVGYQKLNQFKEENSQNQDTVDSYQTSSSIVEDVNKFLNEITSSLVTKFSRNPETRVYIEILLEDLLTLLPYPEWPGAESILSGFMKTFLLTIQNQNFQNIEINLFDLLGKVSETLISIKKKTGATGISNSTELLAFQEHLGGIFGYIQIQASKNSRYIPSAKFLATKLLVDLENIKNDIGKTNLELEGLSSESEEKSSTNEMMSIITEIKSLLTRVIMDESEHVTAVSNIHFETIVLRGELLPLYENFLNLLTRSLESSKIKTKSKAIRILSTLIDKDGEILSSQRIQESVSLRLSDNSPSVRDAVIDLISKIINSKPELSKTFYKPIGECIHDSSVQVRKRVIRLLGVMYLNLESTKAKVYISAKLLMGLYDEEDSVIDLIKSHLIELWFDGLKITSNIEVLVDVVGVGGKVLKIFGDFLRKDIVINQRQSLLKVIVIMLDRIHDYVDREDIEKGLKLVSTLVKCDTTLISQEQLISLQPFLVEEKNEGSITFYNLEILKYVLPEITSLRPDYIQTVQTFLIQNLTKFNTKELNEAMPCIWRLCKMKGNSIKLANACISCMKMLKPYIEQKQKEKTNPKLEKLIHLLGAFGTYCKFEEFRELFLKSSLGLKEKESIVSGIVKYLLYFSDGHLRMRNAAIKNLIHVCSTHPKFFLSSPVLKVFDHEFEKAEPLTIHSIIVGFLKFLSLEEDFAEKQNGIQNKTSNKIKLDIEVFHGNSKSYMNDGICAGLAQRYIERILELCIHDNGSLSLSCVEFLQLVVQLGFANPRVCIPTVIALEASDNPRIRKIAMKLHSELYEKHESLTDTSYFEGTKLAIKYIKNCGTDLFNNHIFINNLYGIVKSNYSSRKKLTQSIIKFLQIRTDTDQVENQRDETVFICLNIANTNWYSLEEILLLISKIDVVLEAEGEEVYENLKNEDMNELKESSEFNDYVCMAQTFLALLQLRNILVVNYGVALNQIERFRPNKADAELKQQTKMVEKKGFIVDIASDQGIDYIIQYLQAMKEYL